MKSFNKKLNTFVSLSSFITVSLLSTTSLNSEKVISLDVTKLQSNSITKTNQKWIDSIKESAQNTNTIKIFFTRSAALVYQESIIALTYMLSLDATSQISNNQSIKPIAYFMRSDDYTNNRFDYSVIESNENLLLVKETNDITSVSNNELYNTHPLDNHLVKIYEYYKTLLDSGKKIDIWGADLSIDSIFNSGSYNGLSKLLPYINKIYTLSDGNAQTFSFAQTYVSRYKENNWTEVETKEKWQKLINNSTTDDERAQLLAQYRFQDFLKLSDVIVVFHILEYDDAPLHWGLTKEQMYDVYIFDIGYYGVSNQLYGTSNSNQIQKFISNYELFFKVNISNFLDFIEVGSNYYDKNKKNLVWMGDNLLPVDLSDQIINDEIQNTYASMVKKYPPNEYNYFFKHHPSYSIEDQIKLTNHIVEKANINPIIFKSFGWELFLSWDNYQQHINNSTYTPFFTSKTNQSINPQTSFVGLLYSTSVILTTYSFTLNEYGYTEEQAFLSIASSNFPIVGTYGLWGWNIYLSSEPYDENVSRNLNFLDSIYKPYQKFYEMYLNNKKTTNQFNREVNENTDNNSNSLKYFYIPLITLSLLVLIAACSYMFLKRKNKNEKQN
ncbi:hypothetical protein D8X55_03715 [Malacoplasma penetrans]|uniref:Uncharacterized protein n=1 Tax=Malacoplasma penetrans (strain HF-2) TaxID=272633 RepID=Q8EVD2_MALP2|nr:hypothetical protein [Malacoplasma penetrans]RXY96421.1 hypothetical protein D8X55_03715 [Malacoplasma penetrans]BAC44424.1 conserved hypothetical protein [Malacoplasma penetrans HF-2]